MTQHPIKHTLLLVALGGTACSASGQNSQDQPTRVPSAEEPRANDEEALYDRLGGRSGIAGAVDAVVANLLLDPEVAPYFAANEDPSATPNMTQIKECFVLQIASAAGGPERYPDEVSGGFMCRDMRSAHEGLKISGDVFDKFVSISAETLAAAGVDADDVATLGTVLNSTRSDVVEP